MPSTDEDDYRNLSSASELEEFSERCSLPSLQGCRCEEARLLRAFVKEQLDQTNVQQAVDLGSLIWMCCVALRKKRVLPLPIPPIAFVRGKEYHVLYGGTDLVLPRSALTRELVAYVATDLNVPEFCRTDLDLDGGVLRLTGQITVDYRLI